MRFGCVRMRLGSQSEIMKNIMELNEDITGRKHVKIPIKDSNLCNVT